VSWKLYFILVIRRTLTGTVFLELHIRIICPQFPISLHHQFPVPFSENPVLVEDDQCPPVTHSRGCTESVSNFAIFISSRTTYP